MKIVRYTYEVRRGELYGKLLSQRHNARIACAMLFCETYADFYSIRRKLLEKGRVGSVGMKS
jgi:hypothetical protein